MIDGITGNVHILAQVDGSAVRELIAIVRWIPRVNTPFMARILQAVRELSGAFSRYTVVKPYYRLVQRDIGAGIIVNRFFHVIEPFIVPVKGDCCPLALGTVHRDRHNLEVEAGFIAVLCKGRYIIRVVRNCADHFTAAVWLDAVNLVVVRVSCLVPVQPRFRVGGVRETALVQRYFGHAARSGGIGGNCQLADIDGISVNRCGRGEFQRNRNRGFPSIGAEVYDGFFPAVANVFAFQVDEFEVAVRIGITEAEPCLHHAFIRCFVNNFQLGIRHDIQLGAVQLDMAGAACVQASCYLQRGACPVSVGKINFRLEVGVCIVHDPFPGGHNVGHGAVIPLAVPDNLAVLIELFAIARGEVGNEIGSQDRGLVRDNCRKAGEILDRMFLVLGQIIIHAGVVLRVDPHIQIGVVLEVRRAVCHTQGRSRLKEAQRGAQLAIHPVVFNQVAETTGMLRTITFGIGEGLPGRQNVKAVAPGSFHGINGGFDQTVITWNSPVEVQEYLITVAGTPLLDHPDVFGVNSVLIGYAS